jgi:hypothetical protein
MSYQVINPFIQFVDPTNGKPLSSGKVYFGRIDTDPKNQPTNRLNVYAVQDNGAEVLLAQPITLNGAGQPQFSGSVKQIKIELYAGELAYSLQVYSKNDALKGYTPRCGAPVDALSLGASDSTVLIAGVEAKDLASAHLITAFIDDYADLKVGDDWTDAFIAARNSLRANPVSILDDIGGTIITAYSSGVVVFGRGIYKMSCDELRITQDLGLTIKGQGSRRTNNSVRAATTILFTGTSSGYGFQQFGNGARGLTFRDLDVCYESSGFTGDLIDTLTSPGLNLNNVFVGTFGLTAITRLQTARSCIRSTYDEFINLTDVILDGAVDPYWMDDIRSIGGNPFGGAETTMTNVVIYDATGKMIRHDGNRTHSGLVMTNVTCNPISVDCTKCVAINNIDGLVINGLLCAGSVANHATDMWIDIQNCTGSITGMKLDANSPAGRIGGILHVAGNRYAADTAIEYVSGVITGGSNEYRTKGVKISPLSPIIADIGPDTFLPAVDYSYDIPADSLDLSAKINYSKELDGSSLKFRNVSSRVSVFNSDCRQTVFTDVNYIFSKTDSGRNFISSGAVAQSFTLPAGTPGITVTICKLSTATLDVIATTLYVGTGASKTNIRFAASDIGGSVTLRSFADGGWFVESISGTVTIT